MRHAQRPAIGSRAWGLPSAIAAQGCRAHHFRRKSGPTAGSQGGPTAGAAHARPRTRRVRA
eukprot:9466637-Alexandrium_andersonii.AAC.1